MQMPQVTLLLWREASIASIILRELEAAAAAAAPLTAASLEEISWMQKE